MSNIAAFFSWGNPFMKSLMYYAFYGVFAFGILGGGFLFLYFKQFKYKIRYWNMVGDIKNEKSVTIDRPQWNRARWNKTKTAWQLMFPLFKNKPISPFDSEYIYSGNNVYAFKFGETYVPAEINLNNVHKATFEPIPHHIRNWQELELKQNEAEFAKNDFWSVNKSYILAVITVACVCGLVGLTVYYTYQFASGGSADISGLTNAIRGLTAGNAPS